MLVPPVFLLAALGRQVPAPPPPSDSYTAVCTFTHPQYSGTCTVEEMVPMRVSPRAACRRVLSCLNNVGCTQTYCNATTIRRGWKLVEAKGPPR